MGVSEHLSKQFDAELESIRSRVLEMGGLVESQIRRALEGLATGDRALLDVIATDHRVNGLEVALDGECSHVIVKRQPAASDLRLLFGITKTVTDLERIGDEAQKIARMAKSIYEREGSVHPVRGVDVRHAAEVALAMLRQALDAFARLDVNAAAEVIRKDAAIDSEFRSILRQLVTYMMEDPRTITTALEIVWVAKAIERMGDHAKNMAEYVIYIVKGTDVRHTASAAREETGNPA
jgi:phosphate transport system protein